MSAIATLRHTPTGKVRRLLGVLCVLWFNMAVQPCAMAGADEHDCPHCPTEHHETMAGHHGHEPEEPQVSCAALEAQCGDYGDISIDARGQVKLDDGGQPVVAIVDSSPPPQLVRQPVADCATGPPLLSGASPSLHLLNCVFLK